MSLWLCSSPVSPSTPHQLFFPWLLTNPHRKLSPFSLRHSQNRPKLSAAQQDVVVEELADEIRIIPAENLGSLEQTVQAMESFTKRGRKVNSESYAKLLQFCSESNSVELYRKVHAWLSVVESPDPFVETKLVSLYAKCGCLGEARKVFDGMSERNLFTFSSMIGAYSRAQKWESVLELFFLMVRDGIVPNRFLFPMIVEACGNLKDSGATKMIHSMVVRLGFCDSIRVNTSILSVYAKSGKLNLARRFFDQMEKKNTVSWTAIIAGFIQAGLIEEAMGFMKKMESLGIARNVVTWTAMISGLSRKKMRRQALEMFKAMLLEGVEPNAVTITSVVSACSYSLVKGKVIHAFSVKIGVVGNVRVKSSLVDMYCKCGDLEAAQQVFGAMVERNAFTWNSLIGGYCRAGYNGKALDSVVKMKESGVEPNVFTWNIIITGFFQKCQVEEAIEVMKKMEGIAPDVVTWTSMISGLSNNNRRFQALNMFKTMLLEGVKPSSVTITSIISACTSLVKGKEIHAFSIKLGFMDNVRVGSSLVDMYCKCGDLEAAQRVFDAMVERNVCTWNSLIGGYCQAGYSSKVCELVTKMKESGVEPDEFTWDVMISGYMRNGHEELAADLFQRMEKDGKIKRGTASWTTLVSGYVQLGEKEKAFSMFRKMQLDSVAPNMATVLTVLPACGNLLDAKKVREIHCCVLRRSLESELPVANSLVDTYAKSGNLRYSEILFNRMESKDIITFNSMISVYVSHGFPDLAIRMYDHVRKSRLKPTEGTFLPLIYAYGLSRRVEDGKEAFFGMLEDHRIVAGQEHYSAMVELFGRASRLEEALELIADMPMEPNFSVWSSLLTASRIHRNVGLASRALDKMLALEPRNLLVRRLRAQIDGLVGKSKLEREDARELGRCWIELENTVYTFYAGDQSLSHKSYPFPWITRKGKSECGFHGGHCIEEEDREEFSGVHSEKLALWFALITVPEKSQCIRIVKSLRMCWNCHETVKSVSKLYGREIFVNDSKRLHRFSDGECSCRDYW